MKSYERNPLSQSALLRVYQISFRYLLACALDRSLFT
jgi:hypothetical protein